MSTPTINIPEKMKKWQEEFDLLDGFMGDSWGDYRTMRKEAMAEFVQKGFPTTRWEEWKYTSVRSISEKDHSPVFRLPQHSFDGDAESFHQKFLPAGLECHVVTLVDGHYDASLSQIREDDGLTISSLSEAIANGNASSHYAKIASTEASPFVALNTAVAVDGVFIHLKRGKVAQYPVFILHIGFSASGDEVASQSRQLVIAEDNAQLKVIEKWVQWSEGSTFNNQVNEISVAQDARVELYSVQDEQSAELINFCQVQQGRNSYFQAHTIATAGKLVRNDLRVLHQGEHCETHMYGLYLLDGDSHIDNHTLVDHAMPNCYSNELYKGVLDGDSTAVFNGKVMVRPDAQKTNAFQSNKTILISDGATINTKPQLEIFADDVKCSHGATTGRLDETALFYLRSRGLSEKRARALLIFAFASEVLDTVTIPALKQTLSKLVEERLVESDPISHV